MFQAFVAQETTDEPSPGQVKTPEEEGWWEETIALDLRPVKQWRAAGESTECVAQPVTFWVEWASVSPSIKSDEF